MNLNSLLTYFRNGCNIINSEFKFIFERRDYMQKLKADIKQKIIEVGMKRFKKEGFENTSMKDIATDAGISTGNIYRYFLTKKHLLNEILIETEEEIEDFFDQIMKK